MPLSTCPCCGKSSYEYGFSLFRFAAEHVEPVVALASKKAIPGLVSKLIKNMGAGLGIFSLPLLVVQAFQGLDGGPLLRCRNCLTYVVSCRSCGSYSALPRYPGTAELVQCCACQAKFNVCESTPEFDALGVV